MLILVNSEVRTNGCFYILCFFVLIALPIKKNFSHFWSLGTTGILYFLNLRNHDSIFKLFNTPHFIHSWCLY